MELGEASKPKRPILQTGEQLGANPTWNSQTQATLLQSDILQFLGLRLAVSWCDWGKLLGRLDSVGTTYKLLFGLAMVIQCLDTAMRSFGAVGSADASPRFKLCNASGHCIAQTSLSVASILMFRPKGPEHVQIVFNC